MRYNGNINITNLQMAFPLILSKFCDSAAPLDALQPVMNLFFKHGQEPSAAYSEISSLLYTFSFATVPRGLIFSLTHSQFFPNIFSQMI